MDENANLWYFLQVPPTLRFVLDGEMPKYLLAKDLILQVWLYFMDRVGSFCRIEFEVELRCSDQ